MVLSACYGTGTGMVTPPSPRQSGAPAICEGHQSANHTHRFLPFLCLLKLVRGKSIKEFVGHYNRSIKNLHHSNSGVQEAMVIPSRVHGPRGTSCCASQASNSAATTTWLYHVSGSPLAVLPCR